MSFSLDTNVLVYSIDDRDLIKQAAAKQVIATVAQVGGKIGLQVIGEMQNVLRRRLGKSAQDAHDLTDGYFGALDSFAYDRPDVVRALAAFRVGHYSYWDALLLAAAERAGCRVMFTEDLHDGARFGEIEIINPFSASGLSPRARAALGL